MLFSFPRGSVAVAASALSNQRCFSKRFVSRLLAFLSVFFSYITGREMNPQRCAWNICYWYQRGVQIKRAVWLKDSRGFQRLETRSAAQVIQSFGQRKKKKKGWYALLLFERIFGGIWQEFRWCCSAKRFKYQRNPFAYHCHTCGQGKGFKSQTEILNYSQWSKTQYSWETGQGVNKAGPALF